MRLKITSEQLLSARNLLNNLKKFVDKGYGSVSNVMILSNNATSDTIYIKYEKSFTTAGEMDYENRIASIDQSGKIDFIDSRFKDIFERASFLSECKNVNLDDENSFEKI
jgi:hypothetical protein